MPSKLRPALGLGLSLICVLLLANGSVAARAGGPQDEGKKAKPETDPKQSTKATKYAVVQVNDDYRVVAADKINNLRKDLELEYKNALKSYDDAKKAAQKKKLKFTDPKPEKARFKIINQALPTEEAAEELAAKLNEKEKPKEGDSDKGGAGEEDPGKKKDKGGGRP